MSEAVLTSARSVDGIGNPGQLPGQLGIQVQLHRDLRDLLPAKADDVVASRLPEGGQPDPRCPAVSLIGTDLEQAAPFEPTQLSTRGGQGDADPRSHLADRRAILPFAED